MESLESKLDGLTPEQRKEVEDFVDFLIYRSGNLPGPQIPHRYLLLSRILPPHPLFYRILFIYRKALL
jgi:hypothetical protein